MKYVKNLVAKHQQEKSELLSKITMLEDVMVRDKENRTDYMNMQIKRKIKEWDLSGLISMVKVH